MGQTIFPPESAGMYRIRIRATVQYIVQIQGLVFTYVEGRKLHSICVKPTSSSPIPRSEKKEIASAQKH